MKSLDKFNEWSDRNHTHLSRFLLLVGRQVENQKNYVDLFRKYPANSFEIRDEIEKLYSELGILLEECKETVGDMGNDISDFQDVLEALKQEWEQQRDTKD